VGESFLPMSEAEFRKRLEYVLRSEDLSPRFLEPFAVPETVQDAAVHLDAQIKTTLTALESGNQWLRLLPFTMTGKVGPYIRRRPVGGWDYIGRDKNLWDQGVWDMANYQLCLATAAGLMVSGPEDHREQSDQLAMRRIKRQLAELDSDGVQPIPDEELKTLEQMHQTTIEQLMLVEAGKLCVPLMDVYHRRLHPLETSQPPVVQLMIHTGAGFFLAGVNMETQQLVWCRAVNREGAYITTRWATHRCQGADDSAILEVEPWLREAADTFLRPDAFFDGFRDGAISVKGAGAGVSPKSIYPHGTVLARGRKLRWGDLHVWSAQKDFHSFFDSSSTDIWPPFTSRNPTAQEMRSLLENGKYHWVYFDRHEAS